MMTDPTSTSFKVFFFASRFRSRLTIADHVKIRLELRKRKYDETSDNADNIEYPSTRESSHILRNGPARGERTGIFSLQLGGGN